MSLIFRTLLWRALYWNASLFLCSHFAGRGGFKNKKTSPRPSIMLPLVTTALPPGRQQRCTFWPTTFSLLVARYGMAWCPRRIRIFLFGYILCFIRLISSKFKPQPKTNAKWYAPTNRKRGILTGHVVTKGMLSGVIQRTTKVSPQIKHQSTVSIKKSMVWCAGVKQR